MIEPQVDSIPALNRFENPGLEEATRTRANELYNKEPYDRTVTSPILDEFGHPITRTDTIHPEFPTVKELDDMRRDANAKLQSYYAKNPSDRNAAESNPRVARLKAVGDSARDLVYTHIAEDWLERNPESRTSLNDLVQRIKDNQKSYGNLKDIQEVATDRNTVYKRQNPFNLAEQFTLNSGNPFSTALTYAGQKLFKNAVNSDALVNSAMDRYNNPAGTPLHAREGAIPMITMGIGNTLNGIGKIAYQPSLFQNPLLYTEKRDDQR